MNKQFKKIFISKTLFISVCFLLLLIVIEFSSPLFKGSKLFLSFEDSRPTVIIAGIIIVILIKNWCE